MHLRAWLYVLCVVPLGLTPAVCESGPLSGQGLTVPVALSAVPGVKLAPHRAIYDLGLLRADGSGTVNGVVGRLVMEFADACDGFTLTQRLRTELSGAEGNSVSNDFSITSWESRDGKSYRFNLKNMVDGEPADEFVGRGQLKARGQAGKVTFSKPAATSLDLPAGTVYPTEHLALLIQAARNNGSSVPVKVFDGSADDGYYDVGGFVGREVLTSDKDGAVLAPLKSVRSWRVRLAYFPSVNPADRPQYEIGFRLFENGISDDLVLDYGDYALKGVLQSLELLPDSGC